MKTHRLNIEFIKFPNTKTN